jgi:hypothetical protein
MTRKLIPLLLMLLAGLIYAPRANAGACSTGTLNFYLVVGFSCTIGDRTFSTFYYVPSATGGATLILASDVLVTPQVVGGEEGFLFSASWGVTSLQTQAASMGYTVTVPSMDQIADASLSISGAGFTNDGKVFISEGLSNSVSLFVFTNSNGTVLASSATFAGVSSLDIVERVDLDGGINGTAALSNVTNLFSPTPEPSSLLMLGTGVVGLAGFVRRKLPR